MRIFNLTDRSTERFSQIDAANELVISYFPYPDKRRHEFLTEESFFFPQSLLPVQSELLL